MASTPATPAMPTVATASTSAAPAAGHRQIGMPTAATRWRCALCGNLTRFDVVRRTRTREVVHADLAGAATVEDREILAEVVESVTCRWCRAVDTVELVARVEAPESGSTPELAGQAPPPAGAAGGQ